MPTDLRQAVRDRDAVGLLRDLVRFDTHDDESALVAYLARRWDSLGLAYEIVPAYKNRKNITARCGNGGPSLLFNSHTDTVPSGDVHLWTEGAGPFDGTIVEDRLYGRGAVDAKGCLAAMIVAFEAIALSGVRQGSLIMSAVCFEESGGWGTQADVERGLRANAAVVGEPTNLLPKLGHRGAMRWEMHAEGKAAHSASPREGRNAIADMAAVILELERLEERLGDRIDPILRQRPNLTVAMVEGGVAGNVVPARCDIVVDRRVLPSERTEDVDAEMLAAVAAAANPRGAKIVANRLRYSGGCAIEPTEPIWRAIVDVVRDLTGAQSSSDGFFACCDMTFLWNQGHIPTVIFGPGEEAMCHKANEGLRVADLHVAADVYATLANHWLTGASS
jgi:acetylornithine deacetylase/succinyl-diaminopimelate desuccinylase family protein